MFRLPSVKQRNKRASEKSVSSFPVYFSSRSDRARFTTFFFPFAFITRFIACHAALLYDALRRRAFPPFCRVFFSRLTSVDQSSAITGFFVLRAVRFFQVSNDPRRRSQNVHVSQHLVSHNVSFGERERERLVLEPSVRMIDLLGRWSDRMLRLRVATFCLFAFFAHIFSFFEILCIFSARLTLSGIVREAKLVDDLWRPIKYNIASCLKIERLEAVSPPDCVINKDRLLNIIPRNYLQQLRSNSFRPLFFRLRHVIFVKTFVLVEVSKKTEHDPVSIINRSNLFCVTKFVASLWKRIPSILTHTREISLPSRLIKIPMRITRGLSSREISFASFARVSMLSHLSVPYLDFFFSKWPVHLANEGTKPPRWRSKLIILRATKMIVTEMPAHLGSAGLSTIANTTIAVAAAAVTTITHHHREPRRNISRRRPRMNPKAIYSRERLLVPSAWKIATGFLRVRMEGRGKEMNTCMCVRFNRSFSAGSISIRVSDMMLLATT